MGCSFSKPHGRPKNGHVRKKRPRSLFGVPLGAMPPVLINADVQRRPRRRSAIQYNNPPDDAKVEVSDESNRSKRQQTWDEVDEQHLNALEQQTTQLKALQDLLQKCETGDGESKTTFKTSKEPTEKSKTYQQLTQKSNKSLSNRISNKPKTPSQIVRIKLNDLPKEEIIGEKLNPLSKSQSAENSESTKMDPKLEALIRCKSQIMARVKSNDSLKIFNNNIFTTLRAKSSDKLMDNIVIIKSSSIANNKTNNNARKSSDQSIKGVSRTASTAQKGNQTLTRSKSAILPQISLPTPTPATRSKISNSKLTTKSLAKSSIVVSKSSICMMVASSKLVPTISDYKKQDNFEKSESKSRSSSAVPYKTGYPSDIDSYLEQSKIKSNESAKQQSTIKADGSTIKFKLNVADILQTNLKSSTLVANRQKQLPSPAIAAVTSSSNLNPTQSILVGSSDPLRSQILLQDLYSQINLLKNELNEIKRSSSMLSSSKIVSQNNNNNSNNISKIKSTLTEELPPVLLRSRSKLSQLK